MVQWYLNLLFLILYKSCRFFFLLFSEFTELILATTSSGRATTELMMSQFYQTINLVYNITQNRCKLILVILGAINSSNLSLLIRLVFVFWL